MLDLPNDAGDAHLAVSQFTSPAFTHTCGDCARSAHVYLPTRDLARETAFIECLGQRCLERCTLALRPGGTKPLEA